VIYCSVGKLLTWALTLLRARAFHFFEQAIERLREILERHFFRSRIAPLQLCQQPAAITFDKSWREAGELNSRLSQVFAASARMTSAGVGAELFCNASNLNQRHLLQSPADIA
jgi:uncharacterized membrane protein